MEYRLKYREIPWHMLLFIPIGKIVGRCMMDPIEYCVKYPWRVVRKVSVLTLLAILIYILGIVIDIGVFEQKLGLVKLTERTVCSIADCRTPEEIIAARFQEIEESKAWVRAKREEEELARFQQQAASMKEEALTHRERHALQRGKETIVLPKFTLLEGAEGP